DPEYYKFVGPSILEPKDSGFMDHIDTTRPVVYISLGTVFNQNIEFFNLCFEAFADIDASFVVSIGHDNQLEDSMRYHLILLLNMLCHKQNYCNIRHYF